MSENAITANKLLVFDRMPLKNFFVAALFKRLFFEEIKENFGATTQ